MTSDKEPKTAWVVEPYTREDWERAFDDFRDHFDRSFEAQDWDKAFEESKNVEKL